MSLFPWLALPFAFLNWYAVARKQRRIEYFAKPATLIALLLWYLTTAPLTTPLAWVFGFGLFCGLLGDVFLMLPPRFFIAGLAAFLLGHLAYVAAFLTAGLVLTGWSLLVALMMTGIGVGMGRQLFINLQKKRIRGLRGPVAAYISIIGLMAVAAFSTVWHPAWQPAATWWIVGGAALFVASDFTLAWGRFIQPFRGHKVLVMVTYHLAQMALAVGVVMQLIR